MSRNLALITIAFLIGCGGAPEVKPDQVPTKTDVADAQKVVDPANLGAGYHENFNATLWVQTSAEYDGTAHTVYAAASAQLDAAIKDKTWVATDEQSANFKEKPPAIILDLDETVLDNSPYQARLIKSGESFNPKSWDAWCNEGKAGAVPGAIEFLKVAKEKGVTIFYVSNRDVAVKEATKKNLVALGAPMDDVLDTILLKNQEEGWGSDKRPRRAKVAETHRIIMLFGDNLGDFAANGKGTTAERNALAAKNAARFGKSWFMLPNPMYGYWESSLFDYEYGEPKAAKDAKKASHFELKN